MLYSLGHKFSHRIQRAQVQFTIEYVVVLRLGDDLLACNFASLVITARHMNVSTTSSQIQDGFATDSCITSCHNHHFAIDANVAVELATLNPFSMGKQDELWRKAKTSLVAANWKFAATIVYAHRIMRNTTFLLEQFPFFSTNFVKLCFR